MTPNYLLIIFCTLFSFFCALSKQIYDKQYKPKNYWIFFIDVILSSLSGVTFGLILTEYIKNELTIIGLSGLGGMFGVSALKTLIKLRLGKKIKIHIAFEDENNIIVKSEHTPSGSHCDYENKKQKKT